jgi:uncharacterized protein YfaS (alpha-2-macroglobulin family)
MIRISLMILTIFLLFSCGDSPHQKRVIAAKTTAPVKTTLLRITPAGKDVLPPKEIMFQFRDNVIALGKMDRNASDINIEITPPLPCQWRWIDRSSLACRLSDEIHMKSATQYEINIKKNISISDKIFIPKKITHTFSTMSPKVRYITYEMWMAPDVPYLHVYFNMPVTKASVKENLLFLVHKTQQIPIAIIKKEIIDDINQSTTTYRIDDTNQTAMQQEWIIAPKDSLGLDTDALLVLKNGPISSFATPNSNKESIIKKIHTYPKFEFLGLKCSKNKQTGRCNPLQSFGLSFSSPVLSSSLKKALTTSPPLNGGLKDFNPWANRYDYSQISYPHYKNDTYTLWLPTRFKAFQDYKLFLNHLQFTDEFGRRLSHDIEKSFATDHRSPELKLTHRNVVLEKELDSSIPLYVTNIHNIDFKYTTLQAKNRSKKSSHTIATKDIQDLAYKIKMGIRETLHHNSGAIYGEVSSPEIKKDYPRPLFAQVTPFQVHTKLGHFNSLVWVTDFKTAHPVEGAKVTLYKGFFNQLDTLKKLPFSGVTDADGIFIFDGTQSIDKQLEHLGWLNRKEERFFIKIEKDNDIALLPLDNNFKVISYGVYSDMHHYGEHAKAWGTTAQGVYKLGDTVAYKIYVRDQNNSALITPKKHHFTLKVFNPLNKLIYEKTNFSLNEYGTFNDSFTLSKEGAVGYYSFTLEQVQQRDNKKFNYFWEPMSILVSDFTPASFNVSTEVNGTLFINHDTIAISSRASMFSGAAYSNAEVRVTGHLYEKPFTSSHPMAKGFYFGSGDYKEIELFNIQQKLNQKGELITTYKLNHTNIPYAELFFESSVKDERGKYIASSTQALYAQVNRFVGLKTTEWLYHRDENATVELLVVNEKGVPVLGTDIVLRVEYEENRASRIKGPGNAFITKNSSHWIQESSYTLTSKTEPLIWQFIPKHTGSYRITATIKDSHDQEHISTIHTYVSGSSPTLWRQSNDSTLQIIPQSNHYKVGQTAKYLVKNPFANTKALITIERYGILDSWIQEFTTHTPIIEVPIKPQYIPGFYLSVTVLSPRVAQPLGDGIVDLGKPSYKMGYVRSIVTDAYKKLSLTIKTDKSVYEPQEKVALCIHVNPKASHPNNRYELAVAVIDEALYALNVERNSYYDPYSGFNSLDTLDVTNFSLISRLIGRQKFEKKGANQGGDGGKTTTSTYLRDDFKYIAYWNPAIVTNTKGDANLTFNVPDNLTGWKVIVIAVDKNDLMGHSEATFLTNRSTEIRAVMPNQLLRGDQFQAGFNIMNRTDKRRQITVDIQVTGSDVTHKHTLLTLQPHQRKTLYIPIEAKKAGSLIFDVTAHDALDTDHIKHTLSVAKRSSLETMAHFSSMTQAAHSEVIKIPSNIIPDVGKVSVVLSPSVIANIDGAFKYLKEYPYRCWEQRLSRAVAASLYLSLHDYIADDFKWNEAQKLITTMRDDAINFQAPNGGMAFYKGVNEYVSPYLSAYTALEFAWLKKQGYPIAQHVENQLHHYLLSLLSHDAFAEYYSKAMSATVRAVALNALSKAGKIHADEIERYFQHYPNMSLFGKANYLQAMMQVNNLQKGMKHNVLDAILSSSSQSTGTIGFNEAQQSQSAYLLATPMRSNCSILTTLLMAQNDTELRNYVGDIAPKLAQTITQRRGTRDYWENTQENIFCMSALADYAKAYEAEPSSMRINVHYDSKVLGETTFNSKKETAVTLSKDLRADDSTKEHTLNIAKEGQGRLYYTTRLSYAPKDDIATRVNSGMEVRREYSVIRGDVFTLLKSPMQLKQGEIVRVDLFISLPTARHFVVLNDPIPGGLEAINSDLATTSVIDAQKGDFEAAKDSWYFTQSSWSSYGRYNWSFYHKELRDASARFYSEYLPAGHYHLSYTAQAIAAGSFSVMPTQIEEMYHPDIYGKSLPMKLIITPK